MSKLEVNHTTLEYTEHGSGDPVVFIHGSASDYRTWNHQQDEFSKHYKVITYSRRYHWPNEKIREGIDYSMAEQLDDLQAVVRSLNTTPVHLIGHSYGASLAMLLAIREPRVVRTLVLAEPPVISFFVSNNPKLSEILKLFITRPRIAAAIIKFSIKGISPAKAAASRNDIDSATRFFGSAVLGSNTFLQLTDERREQVFVNSFKAEFLDPGFLPLNADDISRVQTPSLLLTGQYSPRLFHLLIDVLAELLPDSRRFEIEESSHIMHEDNPSRYNNVVLSFLAGQSVT